MANRDLYEEAIKRDFMPRLTKRAFLSLIFVLFWIMIMITMYVLPVKAADKITNAVKSITNMLTKEEIPVPTNISAGLTSYSYSYFGDEKEISLYTLPSDADKGFTLSSDSPYVEITEKGFKIVTTKSVAADITVTSTANPSLTYNCKVYTHGVNPNDERNEKFLKIGEITEDGGSTELECGKQYKITPLYRLCSEAQDSLIEEDAGEYHSTYGKCRIFWNGSEDELPFHIDLNYKTVTFTEECEGVLTVAFLTSSGTNGYNEESSISVNVTAKASNTSYAPESDFELYSGDIDIQKSDDLYYTVLWDAEKSTGAYINIKPQGDKNTAFNIVPVGDALDYVSIYGSSLSLKRHYGTFSLDIVPIFDTVEPVRLDVTVKESIPRSIIISNYDKVAMAALTVENTLGVRFDADTTSYNSSIKWSIISGNEYATIEEDTGVIHPIFPGNIRVRAESEYYGLSDEADIEIQFYANRLGFVKKVIGHFMLYLVLGYAAYVFLRYIMPSGLSSAITTVLFTLLFAIGTEYLQTMADSRGAKPFDMMLNFSGALTGILVAILLIGICNLVSSVKNKKAAKIKRKCIKEFTFEDLLLYRKKDF